MVDFEYWTSSLNLKFWTLVHSGCSPCETFHWAGNFTNSHIDKAFPLLFRITETSLGRGQQTLVVCDAGDFYLYSGDYSFVCFRSEDQNTGDRWKYVRVLKIDGVADTEEGTLFQKYLRRSSMPRTPVVIEQLPLSSHFADNRSLAMMFDTQRSEVVPITLFSIPKDDNNVLMVEGVNIQCWTRSHVPYALCGLVGFGIYFPLAIYTLPRIQTADPTSEIIRDTRFLYIQKMLYVTLVVLQTMRASADLYPIVCALIISILLMVTSLDAACNVRWINRAQTLVYVAAAWASTMSLWAEVTWKPNQDHKRLTLPVIFLVVGYVFILGSFVVMGVSFVQSFHKKTKSNLLSAFGQETTERTPLLINDLRPALEGGDG
ncbi:hypothetical protein PROFUN_04536 [Planoprotostelium fungivorum]|uniref:Transmembrane protein n=1 Tax=Planoprotostelium fungivorum TaxID=1890364 RepID=A0A2P6NBI3_9EUKA|nr:hypothetical protein PROFUN_04536 [Planoprotostelium fungivorum]